MQNIKTVLAPIVDRRYRALTLLLLGCVCLGVSPVVVKAIALPPEASAFYRVTLAFPIFFAINWLGRGKSKPRVLYDGSTYLLFLFTAIFFAADLALMHIAIRMIDVAVATLFTNCAPLFVGILGFFGFIERPTRQFWKSLPLAMAGIIFLVGVSNLDRGSIAGYLLALATAVFYAGYLVGVRQLRARGIAASHIMTIVTAGSSLLILPVFLSVGAPIPGDTISWLLILILVLIGQVAGQGFVSVALRDLPVAYSSLVLLGQPVIAAALSWMLIGENLSALQVTGIGLVLVAIHMASKSKPS